MPVDSVGPSLQEFARMASQVSDGRTIRSRSNGLSTTRLPTWASTNRKAMEDFISALRTEFGSRVADAAALKLMRETDAGRKPLKAKMVTRTIDKALRTMHHNLNVKDKFMSGIDRRRSFDLEFALKASRAGLEDDALIEHVKQVMRTEMNDIVADAAKLTEQEVLERFDDLPSWETVSRLKTTIAAKTLPGSWVDKFDVLRFLKGEDACAIYALHRLPQCRWLQPEGALSLTTVWKACVEETMPDGVTEENFSQRLAQRIEEHLRQRNGAAGKAEAILGVLSDMKLSSAFEIASSGRPVRKEDFLAGDLLLRDCQRNVRNQMVEEQAAQDLCRVASTDVKGRSVDSGALFHVDGGEVRIPFGEAAMATLEDPVQRMLFAQGKPSAYTRNLRALCAQACGGRNPMTESLMSLFSRTPLRILGAEGGKGATGRLLVPRMNEYMPQAYEVQPQRDGSVRVAIRSLEDEQVGSGRLTITVRTDGEITLDDVLIESADTLLQRQLADHVDARLAGRDDLPAVRGTLLAQVVKTCLTHGSDKAYQRPREEWNRIIDDVAASVDGHRGFEQLARTLPERIDPAHAEVLRRHFQELLASSFKDSHDKNGPDDIAPPFYKDFLRGMLSSYNGRELPDFPGNVPQCDAISCGRPSVVVRTSAMKELVLGTIENPQVRKLVTFLASQAGIVGSQSIVTMGAAQGRVEGAVGMWRGQPSNSELMAGTQPNAMPPILALYQFPNGHYDIVVDPLIPGTQPEDPVNADRKVHIVSHSQDDLMMSLPQGAAQVPLMKYRIAVDVPLQQTVADDEVPYFEVLYVEGERAAGD